MKAETLLLSLALVVAFAIPADAAKLGDRAPVLQIDKWIKGRPVSLRTLKGRKVVVVEFWATWCSPCRASIPHLTEMQKKYRDQVVFVSITKENAGVVKPFVDKMGDKMDYIVATDNQDRTYKSYMTAYGQNGIPHAFIVDKKGNVVYHGHPMASKFENTLKAVISGKATSSAANEKQEQEAKLVARFNEYFKLAAKGTERAKMNTIGQELLAALSKSPSVLNKLAWDIETGKGLKYRDHTLALRAAKKACDLTYQKEPAVLDTYARVLFNMGRVSEAIRNQKKAVDISKPGSQRAQMEQVLKQYQSKAK